MSDTADKTGLLLGKFLPPHRGHQYLVDFARGYCGHVTVQVCSIASEPIAGQLRFEWMRDHFAGCPNITVVHNDDPNPQTPEEAPATFWQTWRESLLRHTKRGIPDFVFASEAYGVQLAQTLGARYVPVDPAREQVPISGTLLRTNPLNFWEYLLPTARPYFARRVAIVGPESSGKSTLTKHLARRFKTVYAAEYGRTYLEAVPADWLQADGSNAFDENALITILKGHRAAVEALALQCNGLLFSDTEAIVTAAWSQVLLGYVPTLVEQYVREQRYDLYLVLSATEQWTDDRSRVQPDVALRRDFQQDCVARLEAHRFPYLVLSGSWEERNRAAEQAVLALMGEEAGSVPRFVEP